jgi:hypothetical protein
MSEHFHVNFSFPSSVVLGKIFKWPFPIFTFLWLSPFWRRSTWPFIWTNLSPLYPRIICTKLRREDFLNCSVCFYSFATISPWRRASPSFENLDPLSPLEGWFVSSMVKIGPVVFEKIFKWPDSIFFFFFTFLWLSPLWKGPGPLFEQTWIPFIQG